MAKEKQHRALFELLAQERRERGDRAEQSEEKTQAAQPTGRPQQTAQTQPTPLVRRQGEPSAGRAQPTPQATAIGSLTGRGMYVSRFQLAVALLVLVWLCVMAFLVGRWTAPGDDVPEKNPTAAEIRNQAPTDRGGEETTSGRGGGETGGNETGGGETEQEGGSETTGEETGGRTATETGGGETAGAGGAEAREGRYRVRIIRLPVRETEYNQKFIRFMNQNGIDTTWRTGNSHYVLYSKKSFMDRADAEAYARRINQLQAAFQTETGWPTPQDAYVVERTR